MQHSRRGYRMDGRMTQNVEAMAESDVLHDQLATAPRGDGREIETVVEHGETWRLLMGLARPEVEENPSPSRWN